MSLILKKPLKILISQPSPSSSHSPFHDLEKKHKIKITFSPFVSIEGETVKNIRLKKIHIPKPLSIQLLQANQHHGRQ